MWLEIAVYVLAGLATALIVRAAYSLYRLNRELAARRSAAFEPREERLVTVDYENGAGARSELVLDPEDEESIKRFLATIRQEEALRSKKREPTAAR